MITHQWIPGDGDYTDALTVRRAVFMDEQGYSEQMEVVPEEERVSLHLVIYDDGIPVGCGRLLPDPAPRSMHAGRIAVLKSHRGTGLGRVIVRLLTEKAKERGAEIVHIGAQKYAVPFYEKCGYHKCSAEYMDGHIPHIAMARTFALDGCGWNRLQKRCRQRMTHGKTDRQKSLHPVRWWSKCGRVSPIHRNTGTCGDPP